MIFNDQRMCSSLIVFLCLYEVIVDFGEITQKGPQFGNCFNLKAFHMFIIYSPYSG